MAGRTDAVRDAIMRGALEPERRLTERELGELTGVSRTSRCEALCSLQALNAWSSDQAFEGCRSGPHLVFTSDMHRNVCTKTADGYLTASTASSVRTCRSHPTNNVRPEAPRFS